jgi:hypothetical protein
MYLILDLVLMYGLQFLNMVLEGSMLGFREVGFAKPKYNLKITILSKDYRKTACLVSLET